jgi:hypothetical protein
MPSKSHAITVPAWKNNFIRFLDRSVCRIRRLSSQRCVSSFSSIDHLWYQYDATCYRSYGYHREYSQSLAFSVYELFTSICLVCSLLNGSILSDFSKLYQILFPIYPNSCLTWLSKVKEHVYYPNLDRVNQNSLNKRGGIDWLVARVH